jgi:hypothetical protein
MIRYHRSLKVPGGSMVARLKLKEIDGRAPPGVEVRCRIHVLTATGSPKAFGMKLGTEYTINCFKQRP